MKRRLRAGLSAVTLCLSTPALAAPFDVSKPFLCAAMELQACIPGGSCDPQDADDMDAPRFLNVSVADKKITGTRPSGADVDAPIEVIRHSHDLMFLQGSQETFSWTMTIGEKDGKMVLTMADNEDGIVVFGACTNR
jgi:hypothetical protein